VRSGKQHEAPDHEHIDQGDEDRRAADVLGALGQVVLVEGDAVDGGLEAELTARR
jgi:hypothetical protein